MFRTNLKIAFRAIRKHRSTSLTNIAGFALGLACAFLMLLYIAFELSFDRSNANASRIFRLTSEFRSGDRVQASAYLPGFFPLESEFPEVETTVRLFSYSWREKALVAYGEKSFFEDRFFLADPSIFEVFSFDFVKGDARTALKGPDSLVLGESAAGRLFGSEDPMGKVVSVRNLRRSDMKVTAVVRDLPRNSHFHCDFIAPMAAGEDLFWDGFEERNSPYVYLLVREDVSSDGLEAKIGSFLAGRYGEERGGMAYRLQPLASIHLHSHLSGEIEPGGNAGTLYLMTLLAVVVLAVAAINFVNLATARSIGRAREVGLKKVVGARRRDLIRQFLTEAVIFSFLALPVALTLVQVFLPAFNMMLKTSLSLVFPGNVRLLVGMILTTLALGFVSGLYPAFLLSRFTPISALRGKFHLGVRGAFVRQALVILQFAASVVLFIGALVVYSQMRYVSTRDLGFERTGLVIVPIKDFESLTEYDLVKTAFLRSTAVESVTASQGVPSDLRSSHAIWYEGLAAGDDVDLPAAAVDFDFLGTYGIRLARGRDFSNNFATDEHEAYIVNEAAVRFFGWSEPLDRKIQFSNRGLMRPEYVPGEVVGVVEDFHFRSLHERIRPLVLKVQKNRVTAIAVRVSSGKTRLALDFLAARWKDILPGRPFDFHFFEDDVERLYQEDRRTGRIFSSATVLSILIAGLGVFGLASFSAAQRTKEVGIRKVLGASAGNIVWMFSKEFGRLVVIANLVALPPAYYLMHRWIQGFAYRAGIGAWIFILAAGFSLAVALGAVGGLAVKSALSDPVSSLRYE